MGKTKFKKSKKPRTTDELYDALTPKERRDFLRMEYITAVRKVETNIRKARS
jgi:hypothetical protein